MKRMLIWLGCMLATLACGSDGGDTAPTDTTGTGSFVPTQLLPTTLTQQQGLTSSEWEQLVAVDEALQELLTQASASGYQTFAAAGEGQDDATATVVWAVYTKTDDPSRERIVARGCDASGKCESARVQIQGGVATFEKSDGSSAEALFTANPILLKDLADADHDSKTTLAAALTAEEVPAVNLQQRRMVIANAYGDVFGIDTAPFQALASHSGAYTLIEDQAYAQRSVIEDALQSSTPLDALIWVGASVREKLGSEHKTIGMTVNRGVYGDETFKAITVKNLLKDSPFGGPGLVVLIGDETRGDGSAQEDENLSLFKELSDAEMGRTVVGFRGRPGLVNAMDAAQLFLSSYFGGATLATATLTANDLLSERGSDARLVTSRESLAEQLTFVGALGSLWGDAPAPTAVRSNHYVNIANKCFTSAGDAYSEDEGHANFFVDIDFDGPFFSGTRADVDTGLDVRVEGVLVGTEAGSGVYLKIEGDLKKSVKNISVWGTGSVVEQFDEDHPNRLFYSGSVLATDYVNDKGDTCVLLSPTLTGSTSQPSWIDLP